jgi:alkylhydroperoxidase family enzyme
VQAIEDETSGLLSARERAAVRFAEKLAVDHRKVDDTLWAEVRAHFSEAEIIELTAHATLYIGFGRFNDIIGLE